MAEEFNVSDSRNSRIIKNSDKVKIYSKGKLLYDGPYKDVHIIGMSSGNMFSSEKISFGFPGKVFQMDFYPQNKQDSINLKEVFSDKVREHEQSEAHFKEKYKKEKQERKEQRARESAELRESLQRAQSIFDNSSVAKCPKCRSTSISYQNKVSVGRAIIGGALAGSEGAVLGGLTGKKGYAVCLNCGKRWKV